MSVDSALRRRFGALTSAEVAALDRSALECGVTVSQLMELAGWQVARCAWGLTGEMPAPIVVVCGRGNNGGDGLVAARHLSTWGCSVQAVVFGDEDTLRGLQAEQVVSARGCGVAVSVSTDADRLRGTLSSGPLVIDALLGTGLNQDPREPQASAIRVVDADGDRVLSVDVPSGLDASSGRAHEPCVHAEATCTLAAMKAGLWREGARGFAGRLFVADIGMPRPAWERCGLTPPSDVLAGRLSPVPS